MVMFGTSLNSIGLKQSFVIALGQDIRAMVLGGVQGDLAELDAALTDARACVSLPLSRRKPRARPRRSA
jgi:hypothetical protein